jgi:soluble lytic murein transglycosylase-like protein
MGGQYPFPKQTSVADDIPTLTIRARPRPEFIKGPLLEKEADRRSAINQNQPGTIYVADNPQAKADFIGSLDGYARAVVNYHDDRIRDAAANAKVDPDLLRAIIWYENAKGYYDIPFEWPTVKKIAGVFGDSQVNKTVRPGNINPDLWGGVGLTRENAYDPAANIQATANLLSRTHDRTFRPTVAKVATLYNGLGLDSVNDYGVSVEDVYRRRPWLK